jgi:hypothetical protein
MPIAVGEHPTHVLAAGHCNSIITTTISARNDLLQCILSDAQGSLDNAILDTALEA